MTFTNQYRCHVQAWILIYELFQWRNAQMFPVLRKHVRSQMIFQFNDASICWYVNDFATASVMHEMQWISISKVCFWPFSVIHPYVCLCIVFWAASVWWLSLTLILVSVYCFYSCLGCCLYFAPVLPIALQILFLLFPTSPLRPSLRVKRTTILPECILHIDVRCTWQCLVLLNREDLRYPTLFSPLLRSAPGQTFPRVWPVSNMPLKTELLLVFLIKFCWPWTLMPLFLDQGTRLCLWNTGRFFRVVRFDCLVLLRVSKCNLCF